MTVTSVWLEVKEGWVLELGARVLPPGAQFESATDLAEVYIARDWVRVVDPPEPEPEPDRSDWRAVEVLTELHIDGKSYGAGEVLDLDPSEFARYLELGMIRAVG